MDRGVGGRPRSATVVVLLSFDGLVAVAVPLFEQARPVVVVFLLLLERGTDHGRRRLGRQIVVGPN